MSTAYHGKPSLDNAFARVRRAEEHLSRLKSEIETAFDGAITIPGSTTGRFTTVPDEVPNIIPILVGEIIYNLRAALDYLVFQLAYLDTAKIQKGTKFPIEDRAESWESYLVGAKGSGGKKGGRWKLWLPLLTQGHQAAIKALQPFSGCTWTKTLRAISNPDKHYSLVVIKAEISATILANPSVEDFTVPPSPKLPVNMKAEFSAIVAFEDGTPVIETLEKIKVEVATVLASFNGDFR